jgi:hypothetical protein
MNRVLPFKPPYRKLRPSNGAQFRFSPTQLESRFASIWYKMEFFFPFWLAKEDAANSGTAIDIAGDPFTGTWRTNRFTPNNPYTLGPINYGFEYTTDTPGGDASNTASTTPATRSIMAVFTVKEFPASGTRWIWGMLNGGAWLCDFGVGSDGSITFYEVTGGGVTVSAPAGSIVLGRQHCVVCVSDNSSGMKIYLDGRLVASNGSTGFLTLGGLRCTANQRNSPFTTNVAKFWLHMGGWWPRALSSLEAPVLSGDPFGMVRARPRYVGFSNDQSVNPGAAASTWAVPTPAVQTQVSAAPAPATSTWSVPTPAGVGDFTVSPAPAIATWAAPNPATLVAVSAAPAPAIATWSVPGGTGVGEDAALAFSGQVYPT